MATCDRSYGEFDRKFTMALNKRTPKEKDFVVSKSITILITL